MKKEYLKSMLVNLISGYLLLIFGFICPNVILSIVAFLGSGYFFIKNIRGGL